MKKLINLGLLVVFSTIIVSCTSPEKKAQKAIKDYLQANLNDAKSYESVEFGKLITDSTEFYAPLYDYAIEESAYKSDSLLYDEFHDNSDKAKMLESENQLNEKKKEFEKAKANFKSELIYKMSHKYRAKNKLGAVILEENTFIIDKDFNKAERF
jgi:hypothetical protein